MKRAGRDAASGSRRWFLSLIPATCVVDASLAAAGFAQVLGKGQVFPSAVKRYADPLTDFPISLLTDPAHTSYLPAWYNRGISRRTSFVLYSSDMTGRFEAFRLDLKTGESRQLMDAGDLDPFSLSLTGNDRSFFCIDAGRLIETNLVSLRPREVYRIASGFEINGAPSFSDDGQYAAMIEKNGLKYRLQLIRTGAGTAAGSATTLVESDDEIREPVIRPRRGAVLYRRSNGVWLVNFDARQNYQLKLAEGETGQALWNPDGRSVFYLNHPADTRKLYNLREFTPDSKEEKKIADTTQFAVCASNADASVFVGSSGGKATPHVLLLIRSRSEEH